jgi:hypothetical protein
MLWFGTLKLVNTYFICSYPKICLHQLTLGAPVIGCISQSLQIAAILLFDLSLRFQQSIHRMDYSCGIVPVCVICCVICVVCCEGTLPEARYFHMLESYQLLQVKISLKLYIYLCTLRVVFCSLPRHISVTSTIFSPPHALVMAGGRRKDVDARHDFISRLLGELCVVS